MTGVPKELRSSEHPPSRLEEFLVHKVTGSDVTPVQIPSGLAKEWSCLGSTAVFGPGCVLLRAEKALWKDVRLSLTDSEKRKQLKPF